MSGIVNLTWLVKYYNCNANVIEDYNVLKYRRADIKKAKKKYNTKEQFAEWLKHEMMYYYWSKCEWELIIQRIDEHTYLYPWVGCNDPEKVKVDVTADKSFNWADFAEKHITQQIYKDSREAKIDVYDQLEYQWDKFVDYCWNTRLKYERIPKPPATAEAFVDAEMLRELNEEQGIQ